MPEPPSLLSPPLFSLFFYSFVTKSIYKSSFRLDGPTVTSSLSLGAERLAANVRQSRLCPCRDLRLLDYSRLVYFGRQELRSSR